MLHRVRTTCTPGRGGPTAGDDLCTPRTLCLRPSRRPAPFEHAPSQGSRSASHLTRISSYSDGQLPFPGHAGGPAASRRTQDEGGPVGSGEFARGEAGPVGVHGRIRSTRKVRQFSRPRSQASSGVVEAEFRMAVNRGAQVRAWLPSVASSSDLSASHSQHWKPHTSPCSGPGAHPQAALHVVTRSPRAAGPVAAADLGKWGDPPSVILAVRTHRCPRSARPLKIPSQWAVRHGRSWTTVAGSSTGASEPRPCSATGRARRSVARPPSSWSTPPIGMRC